MQKALSLYELNSLVKEVLEISMPEEYWVEAELSEVRENRGHCYMELIEKDEQSHTAVAKASAKCWRNVWSTLSTHFMRVTGQSLHAGMKLLLRVYPQFHEAYGFSWIVSDIDPTFTMGDMARKRQEIIRRLKEEGVFDLNKELPIPIFVKHIAVISSSTAAGYGDFLNQLKDNAYGFAFEPQLFEAVMQGEGVEASIISTLNAINAEADRFDVVVIIRGGGATSDLSGFDTLLLAENIANFPLPVITGIGHDRDESILDMVSHTSVKTPTAAAAFLIDRLQRVDEQIEECKRVVVRAVTRKMEAERLRLGRISSNIPMLFSLVRTREEALLDSLHQRIATLAHAYFSANSQHLQTLWLRLLPLAEHRLMHENHRIELLAEKAIALDPSILLQRGYSMTLHNGKVVKDAAQLHCGDKIKTRLAKGVIESVVE